MIGAVVVGTLPAAADHNEPYETFDEYVKSCEGVVPGEVYWEGHGTPSNPLTHPWFEVVVSSDHRTLDVVDISDGIDLAALVTNKQGQTNLFLWDDLTHLYAPPTGDQPSKIKKYTICKVHPDETPPTEEPTEEPTETPTEEPTETPTETPTEEPTEPPTETPTEEPTEEPTAPPADAPTEEATETPTETPTPSATPTPETPSAPPTEPGLPDTGGSPAVLITAAVVLLLAGALALRGRFVKA